MYSSLLFFTLFGASAWAQSTASSTGPVAWGYGQSAASSTGSAASGSGTTSTVTSTVPAVGQNTDGPEEIALSYCFPGSWSGPATDTPCYSMEVLNQACYYGPSVYQTATATPSASASPQDQQSCYCNEQSGAGYMYWEYMGGDHGSLGGPGAYSPDFINSLSSAYCGQATPTLAFGKFLTAFGGSTVVATKDAATSTLLGTQTDVSLYFTTVPTGGVANMTANSTATIGSSNSTSLTSTVLGTTTGASTSHGGSSSTSGAPTTSSSSGANAVQLSGFFGAAIVGLAAML
ncbi:MAG: hypothetical protein LQ340_005516 [Diploschistes diacapsis]|nr:MAG: hypothetical protein LQ340_005516 [Diploschistes diacapsis]